MYPAVKDWADTLLCPARIWVYHPGHIVLHSVIIIDLAAMQLRKEFEENLKKLQEADQQQRQRQMKR